MKRINLAGRWSMVNCSTNEEFSATVPGSDFGTLIKMGAVKNPLISGAESEGIEIGKNDYKFYGIFDLSEEDLQYECINLCIGFLDTLCTCYINDKEAFKTNNAHIPVDINIKEYLDKGQNSILFRFESALNYITKLQSKNPLPKNPNGIDGIPYIRKPACHFGWDWGPCIPYCAIGEYIELRFFNKRIENIRITQNTSKEKAIIKASAENCEKFKLISPNGEIISSNQSGEFEIESPELWYTRELSGKEKQPLYTIIFDNGEEREERKIGLRSLYLDTKKDEWGNNFCFVLNGEKIFAKGANLIPFSAIYEDSDNSAVDYYLDLAVKSNFNMIRVWGGGRYASDYLLEKCDELGLLVWQDFQFACQMYPFYDKDFTQNVLNEVKSNVLRMTTHPCLALWCGNNEIEVMFSYLPKTSRLVKSYIEFFYNTLEKFISPLSDVSYIPTSPLGSAPFSNNTSDDTGDTHMWNVWHGLKKLDYYTLRYSRFLSEFGLESLPSMKAIKTFASENDFDIESPAFNRHQKCTGGNKKMLFYLSEMFDFPKHFEDLPYLTGIVQAECIKNATLHFRQNKGRCNGSVFWQYNDVWNCPSWSSVDFEGIPKALQYKAEEFFAPVTFSVKKEKESAVIFAHNDTLKEVNIHLSLKLINPSINKEYDVTLAPNSFKKIDEIEINKNSVLELCFNNKSIVEIFSSPSSLNLKKAEIDYELNGKTLTLKSDTFAYNFFIESDQIPSDNYFSLLEGEKKTVQFEKAPKEISISCFNNIEFERNIVKKRLFRFFYRLKPLNVANYFYYTYN